MRKEEVKHVGKSVLVVNMRDRDYPRASRILEFFESPGFGRIDIIDMPDAPGPSAIRPLVRSLKLLAAALRHRGRYSVVLLAPFSVQYAPVTWIISRIKRAEHVVDGFVGLYETHVEDRAEVAPKSLRARVLHASDHAAYRLADVYLVDTDNRAERLKCAWPEGKTLVQTLPVGAPRWARPGQKKTVGDRTLRILYYGNYIPLHGVDILVHAVEIASSQIDLALTLVGEGQTRSDIEDLIDDLQIGELCRMLDPVPEADLMPLIESHDVIAGIFGNSSKAASVIANKVWQGLAAGLPVITRESRALSEIRHLVEGRLIEVPPADSGALAAALVTMAAQLGSGSISAVDATVHERLGDYVASRFAEFHAILVGSPVRRASLS